MVDFNVSNIAVSAKWERRGEERTLTLGLKATSLRIISTVKTPVKTMLRMSIA